MIRLILPTLAMVAVLALLPVSHAAHAGNAPDFTLSDLDGSGSYSLSDYQGKWVLLDFWASW